MKLALFTNQFPARVSTFLARDIRALATEGIEVDLFPIYPLDPALWPYVPSILDPRFLPPERIHHLRLFSRRTAWDALAKLASGDIGTMLADSASVLASSLRFGPVCTAKTAYVLPKAFAWARRHADRYDYVLSYWGNYAATCAYAFHRLFRRRVPFGMFLHAGTDLYRDRIFMRQKLAYADQVFVVCDFNRRFLQAVYPDLYPSIADKIHLHHLGLDLENFPRTTTSRAGSRLLAVGALSRRKGTHVLLRAAQLLKQRGLDFQVELIGDGPERKAFESLARQLGIEERTRFLGWQPFERVREAMAEATVFVHASPELGDAVPTVIKEALATGLPVVGTTVAGIPELLDEGRCGVLVPPNDVAAVADAVQTLLQDAGLRAEYARLGREHAERLFDMWRNGRELAERLRQATRGPET